MISGTRLEPWNFSIDTEPLKMHYFSLAQWSTHGIQQYPLVVTCWAILAPDNISAPRCMQPVAMNLIDTFWFNRQTRE